MTQARWGWAGAKGAKSPGASIQSARGWQMGQSTFLLTAWRLDAQAVARQDSGETPLLARTAVFSLHPPLAQKRL